MVKKLIVHDKYKHLEVDIKQLISCFETNQNNLVKGDRNTIKTEKLANETVTLKFFKKPSLLKAIIYGFFRESKAKRSYDYGVRLSDSGVSTPQPIAYYEEKSNGLLLNSYYICSFIDYDFTFRELIHNPLFEEREEILKQFTQFTFTMHENNVNFLDHSPGNTLIVKDKIEKSKYHFYLIDLNRMKFEKLSISKRMDNFKKLWLSKTMVRIISTSYATLGNYNEKELYDLLLNSSQGFKRKIIKKKYIKRKLKKV